METAREHAVAGDIKGWLGQHQVDASSLTADVVVGEAHAMGELRSIAGRLRHPEIVAAAGAELPRGLLLSAAPGTGKTTSARWLARAIGDDVPVYELGADELTPTRVRSIFRALAGRRCLLVIDEIDLIGLRREWLTGSREQRTLRALLAALDGLRSAPGPLVVAATTRGEWELDPALVRAGRIGIHITLATPSLADRRELLAVFARGRGISPDLDWEPIAALTEGWTPAELRQMLDDALGLGLAEDRSLISRADVLQAVRRRGAIQPPVTPAPWWDRHRTAIHEAGHVAVGLELLGADAVTSVRLGDYAGGATRVGADDRPLDAMTGDELLAHVAIAYGGLAAETLILGSACGTAADIARATGLLEARAAAGLEPALPPIDLGTLAERTSERLRRDYGRVLVRQACAARSRAESVVTARRDPMVAFASALERRGELEGHELATAIDEAGFARAGPMVGGDDQPIAATAA